MKTINSPFTIVDALDISYIGSQADNAGITENGNYDISSSLKIALGNGNYDAVVINGTGNIDNNHISFGSGAYDYIYTCNGSITGNTITFGSGGEDYCLTYNGSIITGNTISFGSGADDFVYTQNGSITGNTITFGSGAQDYVFTQNGLTGNTISIGNGDNDSIESITNQIANNHITMGNGNGDAVLANGLGGNNIINIGSGLNDVIDVSTNDQITVGVGGSDTFYFKQSALGSIGNVQITHFNAVNDAILVNNHTLYSGFSASYSNGNTIISNGSGDSITLVGVNDVANLTSYFHDNSPSDARLKRSIRLLKELPNGLKLYAFQYFWSQVAYVGLMAQDLLANPQWASAVITHPLGFYTVNYAQLGLRMTTLEQWLETGDASVLFDQAEVKAINESLHD